MRKSSFRTFERVLHAVISFCALRLQLHLLHIELRFRVHRKVETLALGND